MSYVDRLEMIGLANPEWAVKISNFLEVYPEFCKYRNIASMTDVGVSANAWWEPKTLFEYCIYYVCSSGVRYSYAIQQYQQIILFIRQDQSDQLCCCDKIQPKKRDIYRNILRWMEDNCVTKETITLDDVERMKVGVKGLGQGFIAFIREVFSKSEFVCQYTDINYIKGYTKLYGSSNHIREKSEEWMKAGFGRVATSFMFQICHYG